MTPAVPLALAGFCRDCFLLARYAPPGEAGRPEGRAWEQAVSSLHWRPGVNRRQHAGTVGLFGRGTVSGANHEIDGAGHGPAVGIWIEAKARVALEKSDVAVFDLKCFDLYADAARSNPAASGGGAWWPVFVSSEPPCEAVRRLCMTLGIVLCDPTRLPLPTILRVAANPEPDLDLPETLIAEAVRLFESTCRPMQRRWSVEESGRRLVHDLTVTPRPATLGDAMFVQDELTAEILDYMELEAPGAFERRAGELAIRLDRRVRAPTSRPVAGSRAAVSGRESAMRSTSTRPRAL